MVLGDLLGCQAEEPANHSPLVCQLTDNLLGKVYRDRKTDVPTLGADGGSDGHHLTSGIKQRSSAVAKVNGSIGLNIALKRVLVDLAVFSTHDTDCYGMLVVEGISHGHH